MKRLKRIFKCLGSTDESLQLEEYRQHKKMKVISPFRIDQEVQTPRGVATVTAGGKLIRKADGSIKFIIATTKGDFDSRDISGS